MKMAGTYTKAQQKATNKYRQSKQQIVITVSKEEVQAWREYCTENNISMAELIRQSVANMLNNVTG